MSGLKKAFLGVLGNTFLSVAEVTQVKVLSENFRWIEIASDSFKTARWKAGEKIQINTGDWNVRTYTPLSIDSIQGRLQILAFLHGQGPGSRWASELKVGDACQFLGPRSSLALPSSKEGLVLFGDETSFAVASTMQAHLGMDASMHFVFEVSSVEESEKVLQQLGLRHISLVPKTASGNHAVEVLREVRRALSELKTWQIVFTGSAQSIQKLRASLKEEQIPLQQAQTKAYWSLGREGLD